MPLIDRLRIERAIWTLDALVQSLPGRSRRAIRREMRANLRAAGAEVGGREAVRRLGSLRRVAIGYLEAEYGEGRPRPHWLKAMFWVLAVEAVVLMVTFVGHSAFMSGVEAADRHPDGTYVWHGLGWLGVAGDVSYSGGKVEGSSFDFSGMVLVYLLAAAVLGGRLWRLLPAWWRRRRGVGRTADGRY
jgi:hypothetical protein